MDHTNEDTRYLRNRIRHELLPRLREDFNPRVDEALTRLSQAQQHENDLLIELAEEAYEDCVREDGTIDRRRFGGIHPALQRRVVVILAWRYGINCPYDRVDAATRFVADGATGQSFDLGSGVVLRNHRAATELMGAPEELDPRELPVVTPGVTVALGRRFEVVCHDRVPVPDLAAYCTPARQVFDAGALGGTLTVRHRRPGDRFTPLGMTGSRKLKDYFIDLGVPWSQRGREVLLLADERIVWIVGHAIDAAAAVTPETRNTIEVRVANAPE